MTNFPPTSVIPLTTDVHGTIRVSGTRVTLESVIGNHLRGATPEQIVENFPVLKASDVYLVIGYYLENEAEVDAYIQRQREENARVRHEWEAEHPPTVTKDELLARMDAKRGQNDK